MSGWSYYLGAALWIIFLCGVGFVGGWILWGVLHR